MMSAPNPREVTTAHRSWPNVLLPLGLLSVSCSILVALFRLPPIQDETYYWTWSRMPALFYVDHPPGVAWLLALSRALFGDGLLGLRLPTLLSMAIVVVSTILTVRRLAPHEARGRAVELSLILLLGAPTFAIGYLPATPDPFQGAALSVCQYLVVRALDERERPKWMFLAGFALVTSVLFKHSSALIALGACFGALATKRGRRTLAKRHVWLGVLVGLAIVWPWMWSDLESADGSIRFQAARVLVARGHRGLLALPLFAGGLLVALGPGGPIVVALSLRDLARSSRPATVALSGGAILLLALCFIPVCLGGGELNWSMPALVFALPVATVALAEDGGPVFRAVRRAGICSLAIVGLLAIHVAWPFLPLTAQRDTTRRGAGFEGVARAVGAMAKAHHATAIITRRYQLASMMRYHLGDRVPVIELGSSRRSQYDLWARPILCSGDVAIVILPRPVVPEEIPIVPVDGTRPVSIDRIDGGDVLERYHAVPVQAVGDAFDRGHSCEARRRRERELGDPKRLARGWSDST